jgi:hypothetical protein
MSKVYADSFDAHIMHNACTARMLRKTVGIESLVQARLMRPVRGLEISVGS